MRDVKRIKAFCDELAELWSKNVPDWRFSQLVMNVIRAAEIDGYDPFYFEEDKMMEIFKIFFHENE